MADHRRVLSATGLAFLMLGLVVLFLGLVSSWFGLRLPIAAYSIGVGAGLAASGLGLYLVNRPASGPPR